MKHLLLVTVLVSLSISSNAQGQILLLKPNTWELLIQGLSKEKSVATSYVITVYGVVSNYSLNIAETTTTDLDKQNNIPNILQKPNPNDAAAQSYERQKLENKKQDDARKNELRNLDKLILKAGQKTTNIDSIIEVPIVVYVPVKLAEKYNPNNCDSGLVLTIPREIYSAIIPTDNFVWAEVKDGFTYVYYKDKAGIGVIKSLTPLSKIMDQFDQLKEKCPDSHTPQMIIRSKNGIFNVDYLSECIEKTNHKYFYMDGFNKPIGVSNETAKVAKLLCEDAFR